MLHLQPCLILAAVLLGNCGFWLFCFNRINATGLPRRHTKKIEKLFVALCFLLPTVIAVKEWPSIQAWLTADTVSWWPYRADWFSFYGAWCAASCLVLGTAWLESRLWLIPPRHLVRTVCTPYDVDSLIDEGTPADPVTRFLHRLPGNEISQLHVTRKLLRLPREIGGMQGFTIGHLSDLHFTGQYHLAHYHFVIDRMLDLKPDFIAITGDIIDYDRCLDWIEPLLGRLNAPYGCAFVLGNHDRRLSKLSNLTDATNRLGLIDLGRQPATVTLDSGTRIRLCGNERPWLDRHGTTADFQLPGWNRDPKELRIALSHSPDQIGWARRIGTDLMLAGHTHGGQVRFPGIGPIVAPSKYGSRFASGVFYLRPTLMHVSRGVAGTHAVRWRCQPEISLLELTCAPPR